MSQTKKAPAATKKRTASKNETFQIKTGMYFRANIGNIDGAGTIDLNSNGVITLNFTRKKDGEQDQYLFEYKTPGRISSNKLKEVGITNFRLTRKGDHTKFVNNNVKPWNFNGYNAYPQNIGNKPGYSFGCGSVKLTEDDITTYLRIRRLITNLNINKNDMIVYDRIQRIVIDRGGMSDSIQELLNRKFLDKK